MHVRVCTSCGGRAASAPRCGKSASRPVAPLRAAPRPVSVPAWRGVALDDALLRLR